MGMVAQSHELDLAKYWPFYLVSLSMQSKRQAEKEILSGKNVELNFT